MDGNYRTSLFLVMKASVRIFLSISIMLLSAGIASAQALVQGIFHETGIAFDGSWQQVGAPTTPFNVVVNENEMQYGNYRAVRRGNTNVHGFVGRRYNLVNSNGEVNTFYFVVADNGAIIRVSEFSFDAGQVPGFGFSVGYKSVTAYMTAPGYPGQYDNINSGNYNSNSGGNYNSNSNSSSGSQQRWVTCTLCNGAGVWNKVYAPRYNGQSSSVWCEICKGYDHSHYHEKCSSCLGKGGYMRSY